MLIASSPYARRGVLWSAHRKFHGRDDARELAWQAATRVMNPTVPEAFIAAAYEEDPARAAAEYGAEFRSDVAAFVSRDAVEACVARGTFERAPVAGVQYFGFVDPSGGSQDSMTLAISHREDEIAVLDCVREVTPPFSLRY
jgi:hypothetical protein